MQVNDILIIISVCFLGAITPGPSLLIILGITINKGRKEAIEACIGHALGICFYAFIVVILSYLTSFKTSPILSRFQHWPNGSAAKLSQSFNCITTAQPARNSHRKYLFEYKAACCLTSLSC